MNKYTGSCHCGKIAYEFEGAIGEVMDCNCSMCQRRGSLLMFVPASDFTLKTPRENLGTYTFNKHHIEHYFCPTCGIAPFSEGKDSKGNPVAAINVRCVEGVDPQKLTIRHVNGRDF